MDTATTEQTPATDTSADLDMLAVAMEADQATETPTTETSTGKTANAPQDGTPTGTGESAKTKPADDKSAKTPEQKPAADKKDASKAGDEKAESEFTKAKKDQERRDKSWKALEEEKQTFRAEKARMDAELASVRREIAELRKRPAGPARDEHGATAEDYASLAAKYEAQGKDDLAAAARERAEKLRQQAPAASASEPAAEPWKAPEFQAEWKKNVAELMASDPELAKPAGESPLVAATNHLLTDERWGRYFKSHPDGLKAAVEVAKLMRTAHQSAELQTKLTAMEEQLKKAQAETERLNGLLQPRGSHPSGPLPEGKRADQLTDDDIKSIAAAADRGELG
jgi:hypothetical protein